jgi:asparagine synthase (glutamine-hydrolysing)
MCGIVGFNWEDDRQIHAVTGLLQHRGPEQEGFHVGDGVSLGHKRLCILDLSENGRQPIYNEDRTIAIVYNGEIFNFEDLRRTLETQGHQFRSRTDTEVLVHGYEQWGVDLLEKINGQFAFCIFDRPQNRLFLARDRLGIKPLYYCESKGRFLFGSELKVFLKSDIDKTVCPEALHYYLAFGFTPPEQSMLEGVRKLLPGSYLFYDLAGKQIREQKRFWTLSFAPDESITAEQAGQQIVEKLSASVTRRLISDVPLGAFLSGGVDSSVIVGLMREHVKELNTFSIKFDVPGYDESSYAKIVSDRFDTRHHEIEFNAETVRDLIVDLPYYYDEPFADPSMIPTCLVSRVARRHVTVSLSGTGGDELFAGYARYVELQALRTLNQLPAPLRMLLHGAVAAANVPLRRDKLNKLLMFLGRREPMDRLYLKLFSYMFRSRREPAIRLDDFGYLKDYFAYDDDLTNALNFDTWVYLPDCLLVKEDRASMAVSLEARVPFLDHTLVEYAATLPNRLKLKGSDKKHILKQAFRDLLPDSILYRKKKGFSVPLAHYLRNELRDFVQGEIFTPRTDTYYDSDYLRAMWARHQKGVADYSRLIWSILMFNLWYKKWMA